MCTGKQDGDQLPNMLDCSSYFVCIHGYPQLFQCNENLYYDSHLKVCNWPENVTCDDVIQVCFNNKTQKKRAKNTLKNSLPF